MSIDLIVSCNYICCYHCIYVCMVVWLYGHFVIVFYSLISIGDIYGERNRYSEENIYRINGEVSSNPSPKMLKIVPYAGPDRRCMVYLVGVLEMPRTKTGATHSHKESRFPDKRREIKGLVFFL